MLKSLLRKLDDVLRGARLDWLFVAVQELHKGRCGLADVRLEAVQGSLDNSVALAFKLLPEGFVSQPFINGGLLILARLQGSSDQGAANKFECRSVSAPSSLISSFSVGFRR